MSLLSRLASGQQIKLADMVRGNTKVGRLFQRVGVPDTPDLRRVLALPQRIWETDPETEELVELLTRELKCRGGSQVLQAQQAVLLRDAFEYNGAVGALRQGEGKTLVSYLLPTLLESACTVLLLPGNLARPKGKTETEFKEYSKHWKAPRGVHFVGYEELSDKRNENLLEEINPDLIIPDEGHKLQNLYLTDNTPGVVRRVQRFLRKRPTCRFVPMSASLIEERPMLKYHHLVRWAIGEGMPLPLDHKDALVWSRALDAEVPMTQRMDLGALKAFGETREEAFKGYFERLRCTPGVVVTRTPSVAASLQLELEDWPNPCRQQIYDVYNGVDPDGNPVDEHDVHQMSSQLTCGFFYEKDPPPPASWLDARRRYKQLEKVMLDAQEDGADTPAQVEAAIARGPRVEVYERWRAIRDSYQPKLVARWLSFDVIDYVVKSSKPGTLIWTYYKAPGRMIAQRHGLRYFDQDASDERGPIESAAGATCVASVASCSTGRNLQAWWSINRFMSPPPFDVFDQAVCRTHRPGQRADTVYCGLNASTEAYRHAWLGMREKARAGSGSSRMCLADWII